MGKPKSKAIHASLKSNSSSDVVEHGSQISSCDESLSVMEIIEKAKKSEAEFEPEQAIAYYKLVLKKINVDSGSAETLSTEHLALSVESLQSYAYLLLENGSLDEARQNLLRAVSLSPNSGHEKYMYLAQLAQKSESISLYRKGISIILAKMKEIKQESSNLNSASEGDDNEKDLRRALSNAYCAIVEIYMTDLCDEPDAEQECEKAVSDALSSDSENPQAWLTAANFRTVKSDSQKAKEAIEKCLSLYWPQVEAIIADTTSKGAKLTDENHVEEKETEDECNRLDLEEISGIPFQSHISMVRMMIELEMTERAADVLETLLEEDDENLEVYYLLSVIGVDLWKESDAERLRDYVTMAKTLAARDNDTEMVDEMNVILSDLPQEKLSGGVSDHDAISSDDDSMK